MASLLVWLPLATLWPVSVGMPRLLWCGGDHAYRTSELDPRQARSRQGIDVGPRRFGDRFNLTPLSDDHFQQSPFIQLTLVRRDGEHARAGL